MTRDTSQLADERLQAAQENLDLALANDPRTATPLEASLAKLELTTMTDHRGDGIPTQYVHGVKVADAADVLWRALLTALTPALPTSVDDKRLMEKLRRFKHEMDGGHGIWKTLVNPDGPEAADRIAALSAQLAALKQPGEEVVEALADLLDAARSEWDTANRASPRLTEALAQGDYALAAIQRGSDG